MVVTVGIDVHKGTHCAVAVDETGRQVAAAVTVRATDAGHRRLLAWAVRSFPPPPGALPQAPQTTLTAGVLFAVEDCRQVSGRLERALLTAGATVVRVPPKLMAQTRASARTPGKSDPIDALAVARAALREPDLPRAEHTHASRQVKLLVDHREDLVNTRTRIQNRLRWHLHELDPELDPAARGLDRPGELNRVTAALDALDALDDAAGPAATVTRTVRRIAAELVADITALTGRINALEKEIARLMAARAPQLLALPGCGPLTAAKLIGETANPSRFRSEACFAMHAGVAPIPASSGKTSRYRLARGGNRQLNAALHRIAVTQIRLDGPGRAYYQRRRARGDTSMEALRALKRRLARTVYTRLRPTDTAAAACAPAAA